MSLPLDLQAIDARAMRIRALVLDVDGVLTDGRILLLPGGDEGKTFNVRDGLGIQLMGAGHVPVAFLSGRDSVAVRKRAQELGVEEVHLGIQDKVAAYEGLLKTFGVKDENVAYVGDDLPDLPLLERCGLSFAVADAVPEVRAVAHVVLRAGGGQGAVREACERILKAQGAWFS